jgi:osmotically inducible lipoprotein OsmB
MKRTLFVVLASTALIAGCSDMSETQQRTVSGAGIGAAGGAALGAIGGNPLLGASVGAAAGAGAGYVYDQNQKANGDDRP